MKETSYLLGSAANKKNLLDSLNNANKSKLSVISEIRG